MELNNYQKQVMRDLSSYMVCVNRGTNLFSAWREYWFAKDVAVGLGGVPSYNNSIQRVPHVCMKVPTGGGKTFMACASIRRIFDAMPTGKPQVVVWLVPSAPFPALFLILNEDRNEHINEYINDAVTVELSLRSGTRFTEKSRVDRNRMVGVY